MRDIRRMDDYPATNSRKGISPWFRVGLLATYHRGVQIGLTYRSLINDETLGGWRYTKMEEVGEQNVSLIGSIPFEAIEEVEWNGDEYYNYPHIYCYFEHGKQPYEKVAFYVEHDHPVQGLPPFYQEFANYDEVRKRSAKAGLKF